MNKPINLLSNLLFNPVMISTDGTNKGDSSSTKPISKLPGHL